MDKNYFFSIDPEKDLSEQNISREANAIIINLFNDYFATEDQKEKIQNDSPKYTKDNKATAFIEYKENFFTKFKNFIFKLLHLEKN